MRVVVDGYTYGLIKVKVMTSLAMTDADYQRLKVIGDPKELIQKIEKFFPSIQEVKELNLVEIERKLLSIYFKIFERIMIFSPSPLQQFLKSLLERFEIWNIKTFIVGKLINLSDEELKSEIFLEPEQILGRNEFIENLLSYENVEDAINFLKKQPKYHHIIEHGWNFYKERNEIFLFENLLDKLFIEELIKPLEEFKGKERYIFELYVNTLVERYNLIQIFRSIRHKISFEILKQLIIPKRDVYRTEHLLFLCQSKDENDFINRLRLIIRKKGTIDAEDDSWIEKRFYSKPINYELIFSQASEEDPLSPFISFLNQKLLEVISAQEVVDIKTMAIKYTLYLILQKEMDIYRVLKLFVNIFHELKTK
ncbi:MAG: V0D/AC39 family V-type ATPase subunit [Promethearchaeota archaeon]